MSIFGLVRSFRRDAGWRVAQGLRRAVRAAGRNERFIRAMIKVAPAVDGAVHRLSGGRATFSGMGGIMPILVLRSTGARSGRQRVTTLLHARDGAGMLIVGSNFGQAHHPAWSANLIAHPRAEVVVGGRPVPVVAELLDGEERAAAWRTMVAVWPAFDDYAARSGRRLRVFRLTPG